MSADPFNSVGGYSVGIPPVPILDSNGNLTVGYATIDNLVVTDLIRADILGNLSGNITVSTPDTSVLFNNNGLIDGTVSFTYNNAEQVVTIDNELIVGNVLTYGLDSKAFASTRAITALTISDTPDQVLYSVISTDICSMEYTIVGTDSTANTRQTTKLFSSILGEEVDYFEYGTIDINGGVGDFKTQYNEGNIDLTVTPYTNNGIDYKILITTYKQ